MRLPFSCLAILTATLSISSADVTLPALLSDHAVLQRSLQTRIWGKAEPGENVNIALGEIKAKAVTDDKGRWQTTMDLSAAPAGPSDLVVEGKNKLTVADVLVGEVWLCGGQSNMQWSMKGDMSFPAEAKVNNPLLRQFLVPIDKQPEPQDDCKGSWVLATPETVGGFTAVGYYFGKSLQTTLGVPVGLIHSSVPGSPLEVWTSTEGFAQLPEFNAAKEARMKKYNEFPTKLQEYVTAYGAWTTKYDREDKPADPAPFAGADVATSSWTTVTLPARLGDISLPASGAIWLRRTVTVPPVAVGKAGTIAFAGVQDFIAIYWNGVKVAETTPSQPPTSGIYKFIIPGEGIKEGENSLTLRISGASDQLGLKAPMGLSLTGVGEAVRLEGPWQASVEKALAELSAEAKASLPKPPFPPSTAVPSFNYNAMIAPVTPDTIRGVIWYQGEANVPRSGEYRTTFPNLIVDWRKHFGAELPFYFCQLPNYASLEKEPGHGAWAEMREAQSQALKLPKTGEAVLIDAGEDGSLHPRDKRPPGDRLARLALAREYGKPVADSGPVYDSITIEGDKIKVKFRSTEGGLVAKPIPAEYTPNTARPQMKKPVPRNSPSSELEGFAVCGEDQKWVWADAKIDGDTVIVSAAAVPNPIAVRYAWSDAPVCNLTNGSGLPASPFRSDDFPGLTDKTKF